MTMDRRALGAKVNLGLSGEAMTIDDEALEKAFLAEPKNGEDWFDTVAGATGLTDEENRILLRAAITAALREAWEENERLKSDRDAICDRQYALGFFAGWNAGVTYENCQAVQWPREQRGNPEMYLNILKAVEQRYAESRAAIKEPTHDQD